MKVIYKNKINKKEVDFLTKRFIELWNRSDIVENIFEDIKNKWDFALREFTKKFDWVDLDDFFVKYEDILDVENNISNELKESIKLAYKNILKFHKNQNTIEDKIEITEWITCFRENRAIENIALYIPWWTAPLFSTVLMLAIPAKIAWCKNIYLITPPNNKWKVHPAILYTAKLCWIKNIITLWWAQAIWAVAIWTESIQKVDKIFWPWNSFVTSAKMIAQSKYWIAIDMPAWPSEVLIIWDENSNPEFMVSDILSQAEHWPDSQSILVLNSDKNLKSIKKQLEVQISKLDRKDFIEKSLAKSYILITNSNIESFKFSNNYAPEHLIIHLNNPEKYINLIQNAWSVFLWEYSPESAWDYASWTNHTLPTSWFAKNYSWVSVESFQKRITFQKITKLWLNKIWKSVENMAEAEWLHAHKNAISVRLIEINKNNN